ncbi:hypothetical protein OCAE111667_13865 [Occultella aeris]|uniref:Uncharacterized protein n=1 Tax=Occultella aeris TaxID=2761496 RepID=A0A7M4DEH1_9MICO|nr:hypothetical protein HALOF300_00511 [Occultella aeris]
MAKVPPMVEAEWLKRGFERLGSARATPDQGVAP